ncbi:hypothetical protein [Cupriavidus lacunae]|uniref:hypothetical protein n=1 Tax=Cupriavidus lacunae TaxID=2666307 RepID=UPI001374B3D2|nr:hypothetical protein [Cupriavidus lacunae]
MNSHLVHQGTRLGGTGRLTNYRTVFGLRRDEPLAYGLALDPAILLLNNHRCPDQGPA